MKLKPILLGFFGLGLLASCSQDEGPNMGGIIERDGGYVAVNIKLPTVPSTRAINDDFDDGTTNEYAVENAALVIFKGESESEASVQGAYALYDLDPAINDADKDNITSQYHKVAKVDPQTVTGNEKLFAMVMLNYNNSVIGVADNKLTINGAPFSGSFADLLEEETESALFSGKSKNATKFFMTNAPLSLNKAGTEKGENVLTGSDIPTYSDVQTLAPFDIDAIQDTESLAKENPAATIYVERAVAKATLSSTPKDAKIGDSDYKIKFWGWYVDNTEPSTYIVRNLGLGEESTIEDYLGYTTQYTGHQNHRFVGNKKMGTIGDEEPLDIYRTYWCKDPNYNGAKPTLSTVIPTKDNEGNELSVENKVNAIKNVIEDESFIFYPHENTFATQYQDYANTTRAVFRMTIDASNPNGTSDGSNAPTFYVRNGDENVLYTNPDEAASVIWAYLTGATKVNESDSDTIVDDNTESSNENDNTPTPGAGEVAGHNTDIRNAFQAALNSGKSFTYGIENINISFTTDNEGVYKVNDILLVVDDADISDTDESKTFKIKPTIPDGTKADMIAYINSTWKILEYKNGESYYEVRFMHFAAPGIKDGNGNVTGHSPSDLAPWKYELNSEIPEESINTTVLAYGDGTGTVVEENYLGRYGMVRNNWYDLSIGSVKKLGSPVPPTVQDVEMPDDNKDIDKYLSFKIRVLSWAKRTQQVDF